MPRLSKHALSFCVAVIICVGCAKPEPPTLDGARTEVERVLKIWKDRKYIGRMDGVGAKSMDGHDVDRFFPTKNLKDHLLTSYEILESRENEPGDYEFIVSLSTHAVGGMAAFADERDRQLTETVTYHVTPARRGRWFVTDTRLDAQYQAFVEK